MNEFINQVVAGLLSTFLGLFVEYYFLRDVSNDDKNRKNIRRILVMVISLLLGLFIYNTIIRNLVFAQSTPNYDVTIVANQTQIGKVQEARSHATATAIVEATTVARQVEELIAGNTESCQEVLRIGAANISNQYAVVFAVAIAAFFIVCLCIYTLIIADEPKIKIPAIVILIFAAIFVIGSLYFYLKLPFANSPNGPKTINDSEKQLVVNEKCIPTQTPASLTQIEIIPAESEPPATQEPEVFYDPFDQDANGWSGQGQFFIVKISQGFLEADFSINYPKIDFYWTCDTCTVPDFGKTYGYEMVIREVKASNTEPGIIFSSLQFDDKAVIGYGIRLSKYGRFIIEEFKQDGKYTKIFEGQDKAYEPKFGIQKIRVETNGSKITFYLNDMLLTNIDYTLSNSSSGSHFGIYAIINDTSKESKIQIDSIKIDSIP